MIGPLSAKPSRPQRRCHEAPVVDIWRVSLQCTEQDLAASERLLAADELARSRQLRFATHRRRFVVARASLRAILAGYLSVRPQDISFVYGAAGKPGLAALWRRSGVEFNVSHADDRALIAVARCCAVGIDIERIRVELATSELVKRVFSPRELSDFARLPACRRSEAFFKVWTSKEAYVKGRGDGLSLPLQDFDVSVDPDRPAMLRRGHPQRSASCRWILQSVDVGPGYAAALAAARRPARINRREWPTAGDRASGRVLLPFDS